MTRLASTLRRYDECPTGPVLVLLLLVLLLDVLASELVLQDLVALHLRIAVGVSQQLEIPHLHLPLGRGQTLQEVLR